MADSSIKNKNNGQKWEKPSVTKLELSETLGKELPGNEATSLNGKTVIAPS